MILLELFLTFFQIGLFTFGGGYAMIPLIQQEVTDRGWLSMEELVNFIAVSESTPGPFAINISTYIGSEMGGVPGAAFATLGVVLPSFIIILIIARVYLKFKENRIVAGCMSGIRPAVVGLIATAAVSIGKTVFFHAGTVSAAALFTVGNLVSLIIFAIMLFMLLKYKKAHPILVILASAALGIGAGYMGLFA